MTILDNPYGAECYGMSAAGMVSWIMDFSNTYHSKTGRYVLVHPQHIKWLNI
jgi:hypothetical protein